MNKPIFSLFFCLFAFATIITSTAFADDAESGSELKNESTKTFTSPTKDGRFFLACTDDEEARGECDKAAMQRAKALCYASNLGDLVALSLAKTGGIADSVDGYTTDLWSINDSGVLFLDTYRVGKEVVHHNIFGSVTSAFYSISRYIDTISCKSK